MVNVISNDEFAYALEQVLKDMSPADILAVPGAYDFFSEALGNEVVEKIRENDEEHKNSLLP